MKLTLTSSTLAVLCACASPDPEGSPETGTGAGTGASADGEMEAGATCDCPGGGETTGATEPQDSSGDGCIDGDCGQETGEPPSCDLSIANSANLLGIGWPTGTSDAAWPPGFRDVNGDGVDDVAVYSRVELEGVAGVVFGPLPREDVDVVAHIGAGGGYWIVTDPDAEIGFPAIVGDRNGDGLADVVVGATVNLECECGDDECWGSDEVTVYVVDGKSDTTTVHLGDLANGSGGFGLRQVVAESACFAQPPYARPFGDVDGDGLADARLGSVWLSSSVPSVSSELDALGQPALVPNAPAGDVDGDGVAEFVHWSRGSLNVHRGGADLENAAVAYTFEPSGDDFSAGVLAAGDVNGDDIPDIVTGPFATPGPSMSNDDLIRRTFVVFGRTDGATVTASQVLAGEGGFVIDLIGEHPGLAAPGDFDGDGLADIGLGYRHHVFVVSGKSDGAAITLGDTSSGVTVFEVVSQERFDECQSKWQHFGGLVSPGDVHDDGLGTLMTTLYPGKVILTHLSGGGT